jgi:hypothetical protein
MQVGGIYHVGARYVNMLLKEDWDKLPKIDQQCCLADFIEVGFDISIKARCPASLYSSATCQANIQRCGFQVFMTHYLLHNVQICSSFNHSVPKVWRKPWTLARCISASSKYLFTSHLCSWIYLTLNYHLYISGTSINCGSVIVASLTWVLG